MRSRLFSALTEGVIATANTLLHSSLIISASPNAAEDSLLKQTKINLIPEGTDKPQEQSYFAETGVKSLKVENVRITEESAATRKRQSYFLLSVDFIRLNIYCVLVAAYMI